MRLLPGIVAHTVRTARLRTQVLRRAADGAGRPGAEAGPTVVFVHGILSSSVFWQPLMLALPAEVQPVAVDLRGFGGTEAAPVDAERGLRDFSDDLAEVVEALGLEPVHLVGWSMGGGVVLQYALDHPVASLTLIAPVSPYGFGGTAVDGSLLTPDGAGTGGGAANPQFVARLASGDATVDHPTSPRSVYAAAYVKPGFVSPLDELWVESMLSTATGPDNYPGDAVFSDCWPGFGPGRRGVLNTMAPVHLDLSAVVELVDKPPVTWIRGADDLVVSDTSSFDLNRMGQLGAVPDWPGADVAPVQPMVTQTRDVLDAYAARGGSYREVVLADCGHSPHLEHPEAVLTALSAQLGLLAGAETGGQRSSGSMAAATKTTAR